MSKRKLKVKEAEERAPRPHREAAPKRTRAQLVGIEKEVATAKYKQEPDDEPKIDTKKMRLVYHERSNRMMWIPR